MARSAPQRTSSGGVHRSPWPLTSTPIAWSGRATRSMGRRRSEASPSSRWAPSTVATTPHRRRIVVPELPQSSAASLARSRSRPPSTSTMPSARRSTRAPRVRTHTTVAATSAPSEHPEMVERPSASAERRTRAVRDGLVARRAQDAEDARGRRDLDDVGHGGLVERSQRLDRGAQPAGLEPRRESVLAPSASSTMMSTPEVPSWEWAISRS